MREGSGKQREEQGIRQEGVRGSTGRRKRKRKEEVWCRMLTEQRREGE